MAYDQSPSARINSFIKHIFSICIIYLFIYSFICIHLTMGKSTMAEKTAPQYNSHSSCSAGKFSFTVIFSRERGWEAGGGWGGRWREREKGAGNFTIQPFPEVNLTIKYLSLFPRKKDY